MKQLTCTFATQKELMHIRPLALNVILNCFNLNKKIKCGIVTLVYVVKNFHCYCFIF